MGGRILISQGTTNELLRDLGPIERARNRLGNRDPREVDSSATTYLGEPTEAPRAERERGRRSPVAGDASGVACACGPRCGFPSFNSSSPPGVGPRGPRERKTVLVGPGSFFLFCFLFAWAGRRREREREREGWSVRGPTACVAAMTCPHESRSRVFCDATSGPLAVVGPAWPVWPMIAARRQQA